MGHRHEHRHMHRTRVTTRDPYPVHVPVPVPVFVHNTFCLEYMKHITNTIMYQRVLIFQRI